MGIGWRAAVGTIMACLASSGTIIACRAAVGTGMLCLASSVTDIA